MKLRLASSLPRSEWDRVEHQVSRLASLVAPTEKPYLSYFLHLMSGQANQQVRGVASVVSSVGGKEAQNVVWDTPDGVRVLSKKVLREIGEDIVRLGAGREPRRISGSMSVAEVLTHAKTAKKLDYPQSFKEALKFLETEMKAIQKELPDIASTEQVYSLAFDRLQDQDPDFCIVWDRFALAKGLANRGWKIRANSPVCRESKTKYQDLAMELQKMLGSSVNRLSFQEMRDDVRGRVSLHYGADNSGGVDYHLWYGSATPTGANLDILVAEGGQEVARFSENNEHLFPDLLQRVVSDSAERWGASRQAAQFPMQDEVDLSLPESLGRDRRGWNQMMHQVFLALRDTLRAEVPFLASKMFLLGERWDGEVMEYTLRGDRENIVVFIRGHMDLASPEPNLSVEITFERDGEGWTNASSYPLSEYEKTSELVEELQGKLLQDLESGVQRLEESPSTVNNILQRVVTPDLIR